MTTKTGRLLQDQWRDYRRVHRTRSNLLLHLIAVPLFIGGNVLFIAAALDDAWTHASVGLAASAVAMAMQGKGHALESERPTPFAGPANTLLRILLEQWITFPRFVLSGGWRSAWRQAR